MIDHLNMSVSPNVFVIIRLCDVNEWECMAYMPEMAQMVPVSFIRPSVRRQITGGPESLALYLYLLNPQQVIVSCNRA